MGKPTPFLYSRFKLLEGDLIDNCAQAAGTVLKTCLLFLGQNCGDHALQAALADDGNGGKANVIHTVLAMHQGRYGKRGIYAAEDDLADIHGCTSNSIEGSALALDDLAAGLANVLLDGVVIERMLCVKRKGTIWYEYPPIQQEIASLLFFPHASNHLAGK